MKNKNIFLAMTALALVSPMIASAQNAPQLGVSTSSKVPIVDPLVPTSPDGGANPNGNGQATVGVTIPPTSGRPISSATIKPLNLEQKAWDNPGVNKSARQTTAGFIKIQWHPDALPEINMREGLLTIVKFPVQEDIVTTIVSDPGSFEASPAPNRHSIALRSLYAGVDGNIIVHGSSGNVYNFYLRSAPYNAAKISDMTVEVVVAGMSSSTGETEQSSSPTIHSYSGYQDLTTPSAKTDKADFEKGSREFGRTTPVDARNMRNNIDIKVRSADDEAIAPISAWHDDHFTYLDFGPRASSMNTWPVASLVVQGVESPVGTRVTGRDRSMLIVESVGNITLRNGQLLVCLNIVEPNNDGRFSIPVANGDPRPQITKDTPQIVHVPAPEPTEPVVIPMATAKSGPYVTFANLTADGGQALWAKLKLKHPAILVGATPSWIGSNGLVSPSAPNGTAQMNIRVTGITIAQAKDLCPIVKPKDDPGVACSVVK